MGILPEDGQLKAKVYLLCRKSRTETRARGEVDHVLDARNFARSHDHDGFVEEFWIPTLEMHLGDLAGAHGLVILRAQHQQEAGTQERRFGGDG
jgi:hypothetical protein